jgi:serine/threonine protein kinase/cytochrome c-type biogenesis protein CcmH/NrfG
MTPGETISHYRVLSKLGEGGMGMVYKAEDTTLHRLVALKFFRAEDRERIQREGQTAAALNHPNICSVYEVDETNSFLAMEFVDGGTLRQRMDDRPLPPADARAIAIQVAEGLQAAHERGVVHRDIKPGNIMIASNGKVKITDFGLAHFVDRTRLTIDGKASGTPAYMAPEQMRGEAVDRRADIWAFGVLLHEMLTGRVPAAGIIDPLAPMFDRIVRKSLAADANTRYQHIDDLLVDLRQPAQGQRSRRWLIAASAASIAAASTYYWFYKRAARSRPDIKSLAVLPLRNMSQDPAQELFSEATTEALITSLSQIRALAVISRTSAMRFKNSSKSLAGIAAELGVDGVVEGSIQRFQQRVRISVQLVHASTDTNLWARSYDRDMADILLLQSEVARAIADEIRATITPAERNALTRTKSKSPDAQDAYLLGLYHYWRFNERDLAESIAQFERAIQLDPNFAMAYAGLSGAWARRGVWGAFSLEQVHARSRAAALKALELDPDSSASYCSLGMVKHLHEWDWSGAERDFRKALQLEPNSVEGHFSYSTLLMSLGRFSEALAEIERCATLDPLSGTVHSTWGRILFRARRYPEAKQRLERAIELDPQNAGAYSRLADVYELMGDYPRALETFQQASGVRGGSPQPKGSMPVARIYALMGRQSEARAMIASMLANAKPGNPAPQYVAMAYFALGERDRGFQWLEKAFERRDLVAFLAFDPQYDSVRSDPRFDALIKRLKISTPPI